MCGILGSIDFPLDNCLLDLIKHRGPDRQLRESLKFKNFRGHSDTETILYYLCENGIESVKDFNGIFAFAFYDKRKKTVFLARDRYGVKPLYFYLDIGFNDAVKRYGELFEDAVTIYNLSYSNWDMDSALKHAKNVF